MVNKPTSKPIITLKIESGPVSPAQKQAWKRFWQKVISECKREVTDERENP